ncbi:hypothetical protein [Gordonia jacobaea]|uniref:hypothetical protein n=1 Tax=Gordonia jacobaea TaxID=122202 RepID=UPI0022E82F3B|nr:hypothetical protein [Gordonia jacobaea]
MAGFGKYLPTDAQIEANRRKAPGYQRGFGQFVDGSRDAANLKRSQLARQRRERIAEAQRAKTAEFDRQGKPLDPLRDNPAAIEEKWREEFGPDDGGNAA